MSELVTCNVAADVAAVSVTLLLATLVSLLQPGTLPRHNLYRLHRTFVSVCQYYVCCCSLRIETIELMFYVPLDTKYVISETFFLAV